MTEEDKFFAVLRQVILSLIQARGSIYRNFTDFLAGYDSGSWQTLGSGVQYHNLNELSNLLYGRAELMYACESHIAAGLCNELSESLEAYMKYLKAADGTSWRK